MKKAIFVAMICCMFFLGSVHADVTVEGDLDRLSYTGWLPKKAYIGFHYNSESKITGYRVSFQADGGELFDEWKMKKSNGEEKNFPFILESTLIIFEGGDCYN